ncbi:MAG: TIR domain-containing protein [Fusobacteriaceae bacterium]
MGNRTGIYVAFNGCGTTDPTKSDIKYYNLMKAWKENDGVTFTFPNSHERTSSVRDTSLDETLKATLKQRLNLSKSLLFIVTENTKYSSDIVKFEIEEAIKLNLPILLAFVDYDSISSVTLTLINKLPSYLQKSMNDKNIVTISVPFKQEAIKNVIKYSVHNNLPNKNYII